MKLPDLTLREPTKIPVDFLSFDPINPRLISNPEDNSKTDIEIICTLSDRADLGELLESIATAGYKDIEPLVVVKGVNTYVVLEGNRRLAAIRLLRDPKLAKECRISIPQFGEDIAGTLKQVTVYCVASREEARDFLGFKHINGPHRWDSLAKAHFAAEWYQKEKDSNITLREIARRMGDRHDTIKRMVLGFYVLKQAEEINIFHIRGRFPGRPFAFSHLYTALTRPAIATFVGLAENWRTVEPVPNPISADKYENLKLLMLWLYGSDDDEIPPIITTQNPHIKFLSEILDKPKARTVLLNTNNLLLAYAEVDSAAKRFEESLVNAHTAASEALSNIQAFSGNDSTLLELANELKDKSMAIYTLMERRNG